MLAENPAECALVIQERLRDAGYKNVKSVEHKAIGEIIPVHVEIRIGNEILGFIYEPIACHNYNTLKISHSEINVASIDTIMSFYLAFLYVHTNYYYHDRILCMAKYLFELEQRNRLSQNGVLKRFGPKCIGHQETMENIRAKKTAKFAELKGKRESKEFESFFLKFTPGDAKTKDASVKTPAKTKKRKTTQKKRSSIGSVLLRPFV